MKSLTSYTTVFVSRRKCALKLFTVHLKYERQALLQSQSLLFFLSEWTWTGIAPLTSTQMRFWSNTQGWKNRGCGVNSNQTTRQVYATVSWQSYWWSLCALIKQWKGSSRQNWSVRRDLLAWKRSSGNKRNLFDANYRRFWGAMQHISVHCKEKQWTYLYEADKMLFQKSRHSH